jgi:hypothetical protein
VTLSKVELNSNGLIYLVEEISRQYNIQVVIWLLLDAQAYNNNQEPKAEWNNMKNIQFGQKRSVLNLLSEGNDC